MREITTHIEINAPARKVWNILTDFDAYSSWNPFISEAKGVSEEKTHLKIRIVPPDTNAMTFRPFVKRVRKHRELRWLGKLFFNWLFSGEHIFEIVPIDEQRIHFTQREKFRGILVPFLWNNLNTNTRLGFEAMNAALKEQAEQNAISADSAA